MLLFKAVRPFVGLTVDEVTTAVNAWAARVQADLHDWRIVYLDDLGGWRAQVVAVVELEAATGAKLERALTLVVDAPAPERPA